MSFDRLGRFAVRRRWWIVAAWAALILVAIPFAPRAPGRPVGGRLHPRRPRVRAREAAAPGGARRRSRRPSCSSTRSDTLTAGHAGVARRRRRGDAGRRRRPRTSPGSCPTPSRRARSSADGHTAYDIVFLDLPPDDSPDAIPPVAAALHEVPGLTRPDRRRPRVLRRRPGRHRDATSAGASSSPCRWRPSRCCSCSAASSPPASRSPSAARRVLVALAGIFVVASLIPMSIFVLNLATLLGLGLGVDYSLLMTSRFREELAHREGPDRVAEAVRVDRRDRRAGRVLLRPHRAARPPGPRPVRVHDPALRGHRRGDRRGAGRGRGDSRSCRRSSRSSAPGSTGSASARSPWSRAPTARGPASPGASCATRSPC